MRAHTEAKTKSEDPGVTPGVALLAEGSGLGLGEGPHAASAEIGDVRLAVDEDASLLDVRPPPALGLALGVADVVT